MLPIYLASSSPRRRALLAQLGLPFSVIVPKVAEEGVDGLPGARLAEELASKKALAVEGAVSRGIIVAADTIVVCRGKVLGKPSSEAEAREMLRFLSGCVHEVYTGLAVLEKPAGRRVLAHERTEVKFRTLSEEEIARYVATGEPMDKAGAYAAQGLGAIFIEGIKGCYFNVVGLPVARLAAILKEFGIDPLECRTGGTVEE